MKMPWRGKTGLARVVVILATALLLALGLCGANLGLFARFGQIDGGGIPGRPLWPTSVLMITGLVELIAILLSATGLIGCGIVFAWKAAKESMNRSSGDQD